MYTAKLILVTFFVISYCGGTNAQAIQKAYVFDDFADEFCSDPLRARIDNFLTEVQNTPGSSGYVIATTDATIPGRSERYVNAIRNHVRFRNFETTRITFRFTEVGTSTRFQFWVVPGGALPPPNNSKNLRWSAYKTTLYDSSRIDSVANGKIEFGEGIWSGGEPCDMGLNLGEFADSVKSNAGSTAYLIATGKNHRNAAKAIAGLRTTASILSRLYKVPQNRIRTSYAGLAQHTEMQLWLVPRGERIPAFRPGMLEE